MKKQALILISALIFALLVCNAASAETTQKISTNTTGGSANDNSVNSSISADGRYVVYESDANNLVSGDTNGVSDIFLYDSYLNTTIRANRGPSNAQAVGGDSKNPSISADGRYIVYESDATNLVSGDTNGVTDIYLFDRISSITIRANRGPANAQSTGASYNPAISSDGRYIVYESDSTNLVSGDNNGMRDIFLYDRTINKTIRADRGAANAQTTDGGSFNPTISGDGRYVVYESTATNLVFGDTNGVSDIFLYDRVLNKTIRANRGPANAQANSGSSSNAAISADGRYIVYESDATNLVSGDSNGVRDIFLYDCVLNKTIRANRGPASAQAVGGGSFNPSINGDGRYIVYESDATNLVSGDTNGFLDIFFYDRILNKTIRVNRGPSSAQTTGGDSVRPSISADGRYVLYDSLDTNLAPDNTNGYWNVFLYTDQAPITAKMEILITGTGGDVTRNSYIRSNIPNTQIIRQVLVLAKSGTPMITFGDGSGPRVMIVAGVHGNELPSQIAALRLINYLNGKSIKGTIYIIPFVAPSSTAQNTRFWNGINLNSVANIAGTPTNRIINKAKQLGVNDLGDFHSSQPGGRPGKNSILCTKSPTYESYNIAKYVSSQSGSALIADNQAGVAYPGAVEDVSNLAGIPAVTCEVLSPHGTVASGSVDKSYSQMIAFLRYRNLL